MVVHSHIYHFYNNFQGNFDIGVSHNICRLFLKVSSESEAYACSGVTLRICEPKRILLIPDLILSTGFKYLGYKLGVNYNKLPESFVIHCTMNKGYWKDGVH